LKSSLMTPFEQRRSVDVRVSVVLVIGYLKSDVLMKTFSNKYMFNDIVVKKSQFRCSNKAFR
jgi:hypothetical protein